MGVGVGQNIETGHGVVPLRGLGRVKTFSVEIRFLVEAKTT